MTSFPMRITVADFVPSATQKKILRRNRGVVSRIFNDISACPDEQSFNDLAQVWGAVRHGKRAKAFDGIESYGRFMALYDGTTGQPLSCATFTFDRDIMDTFRLYYDPAQLKRSLGTLTILRVLEHARDQNVRWVGFGLWSPDPETRVTYKRNFRPYELYQGKQWVRYHA